MHRGDFEIKGTKAIESSIYREKFCYRARASNLINNREYKMPWSLVVVCINRFDTKRTRDRRGEECVWPQR
jgi:hypothetical protein